MRAIYAGSFHPFTNGHLHVIREVYPLFEHIDVILACNLDKKRRTQPVDMVRAIRTTLEKEGLKDKIIVNADADSLTVNVAKIVGAGYLIRGIRNGMDYEYEENMAKINEELGVKTIFVRAGNLSHVSSSMVMELFKHGVDVSKYVPGPVLALMKEG